MTSDKNLETITENAVQTSEERPYNRYNLVDYAGIAIATPFVARNIGNGKPLKRTAILSGLTILYAVAESYF